MNIWTHDVGGFSSAIRGMRNPMNSWNKSDSDCCTGGGPLCEACENKPKNGFCLARETMVYKKFVIGKADKELSLKLQKAGSEHCKHLRMIFVWVDITAPRYW